MKLINKNIGKSENGFNEKIKIVSSIKSISYFLYNNKKDCNN